MWRLTRVNGFASASIELNQVVFKIVVINLNIYGDNICYFVVEAEKKTTLVVSDIVVGDRLI